MFLCVFVCSLQPFLNLRICFVLICRLWNQLEMHLGVTWRCTHENCLVLELETKKVIGWIINNRSKQSNMLLGCGLFTKMFNYGYDQRF